MSFDIFFPLLHLNITLNIFPSNLFFLFFSQYLIFLSLYCFYFVYTFFNLLLAFPSYPYLSIFFFYIKRWHFSYHNYSWFHTLSSFHLFFSLSFSFGKLVNIPICSILPLTLHFSTHTQTANLHSIDKIIAKLTSLAVQTFWTHVTEYQLVC